LNDTIAHTVANQHYWRLIDLDRFLDLFFQLSEIVIPLLQEMWRKTPVVLHIFKNEGKQLNTGLGANIFKTYWSCN